MVFSGVDCRPGFAGQRELERYTSGQNFVVCPVSLDGLEPREDILCPENASPRCTVPTSLTLSCSSEGIAVCLILFMTQTSALSVPQAHTHSTEPVLAQNAKVEPCLLRSTQI
jgi:hypothetical protein